MGLHSSLIVRTPSQYSTVISTATVSRMVKLTALLMVVLCLAYAANGKTGYRKQLCEDMCEKVFVGETNATCTTGCAEILEACTSDNVTLNYDDCKQRCGELFPRQHAACTDTCNGVMEICQPCPQA